MTFTIRWKLMGSYLLNLTVVGVILFWFLSRSLTDYLVDGIRESLANETALAALAAVREMEGTSARAPSVAREIGQRTRARVTIMNAAGDVIGDSDVSPDALDALENHLDRPEIQSALSSGRGSAIRHSNTLGTDMLYVAVLLESEPAKGGVIRLALPLSAVDEAKASLHAILAVAVAVAAALSVVLSYLLSHLTSRRLRTMAAGAARFGAGDFSQRLPVRSRDEMGDLSRVLNEMAERLQSQMERLAADRNRLDAILLGMGEGLLVIDADGLVTLVNPALHDLFGLGGPAAGRPLYEISRQPLLHKTFSRVVETRMEQTVELALSADRGRQLLTHWVPLLEGEDLKGVVAVFHDISDLKRLERIRRDFVANVSHELRTPVTVIKGYAETLDEKLLQDDPATALRFISVIQAHAQRLTLLIEDLLTLAKLEAEEAPLDLQPCELNQVLSHCCSLLEPKAAAKGIALQCGGAGEGAVLADVGRLEQVLVNLLDNAVKFTPEGGRVSIDVEFEQRRVRVVVRDTGPGIPVNALPRIFERFYRVDDGRSRQEGGTGLGLAIVKHIVQLHGGSVEVESPPGEGATFSFTLQRA